MRHLVLTLLVTACFSCGKELSPYEQVMQVITETQANAEGIDTLAELQECQTYFNDKIKKVSEKHKNWTGTEIQENQINEGISLIYQLFELKQLELGTDTERERIIDVADEDTTKRD